MIQVKTFSTQKNRTPTEKSGLLDKIEYLDDKIGISCAGVKEPD
jgi:hypothetical protein